MTTPPGWYPDPDPNAPPGRVRWWSGTQWGDYGHRPAHPLSAVNALAKLLIAVVIVGIALGAWAWANHRYNNGSHAYYCQEAHKVGDYHDPTCARYP